MRGAEAANKSSQRCRTIDVDWKEVSGNLLTGYVCTVTSRVCQPSIFPTNIYLPFLHSEISTCANILSKLGTQKEESRPVLCVLVLDMQQVHPAQKFKRTLQWTILVLWFRKLGQKRRGACDPGRILRVQRNHSYLMTHGWREMCAPQLSQQTPAFCENPKQNWARVAFNFWTS